MNSRSAGEGLRHVHYLIFLSFALGFLIWGFVSTSGIMTINYFKDFSASRLVTASKGWPAAASGYRDTV